jgi:hypothetical protein
MVERILINKQRINVNKLIDGTMILRCKTWFNADRVVACTAMRFELTLIVNEQEYHWFPMILIFSIDYLCFVWHNGLFDSPFCIEYTNTKLMI